MRILLCVLEGEGLRRADLTDFHVVDAECVVLMGLLRIYELQYCNRAEVFFAICTLKV